MTNQMLERFIPRVTTAAALLGVGLFAGSISGCGGEEEVAVAPQPTQQQTRPVERRASLDGVELDARVQFPGERLPMNQALAEAVASLASALARGDEAAMRNLLDSPSEAILAALIESGDWEKETSGVEVVRVAALEESDGEARIGLAMQDASGAYLLGWQGRQVGGAWVFAGLPVGGASASRATDLDDIPLDAVVVARRQRDALEPQLAEPDRPAPRAPSQRQDRRTAPPAEEELVPRPL